MAQTPQNIAKAFKALSNPNRLRVYTEIMQRQGDGLSTEAGCPLTDLMPCLKIGAPTVSHHIKELVNADLIHVQKNGKFMTCFMNETMRKELQAFFIGL